MEDEVEISEGMPVKNENGDTLGTLSALLVDEDADEEEADFLILKEASGAERLIPYDAVMGIGDGDLILDVPAESVARFPKMRADEGPTEAEIELAYDVYEEGASGSDDDSDD